MQHKESYFGFTLLLIVGALCVLMLNAPYAFTYLLTAGIVLVIAAAVGVMVYVVFWCLKNRVSPVVRTQAIVVRRRKKDWDYTATSGLPVAGMMGSKPRDVWKAYSRRMARGNVTEVTIAEGTNLFVTFSIDGKEIEFSVSEQDYIKASEGTQGLLVYQGEQFKHFIPDLR